MGCWKKSDSDDASTFLQSSDIFDVECSEQPHKKGGALYKKMSGAALFLQAELSVLWEQLKKGYVDTGPYIRKVSKLRVFHSVNALFS